MNVPEDHPEQGEAGVSEALPQQPPPPPFSSSLPEIEPLPRPRIVLLVAVLVAIAAIAHVWLTFTALADSSRIRAELVDQLGKEAPDFSDSDIRNAVNVLFGVAHGLGILLLLGIVYNVNLLMSRRVSGRTGFTVLTLLFLPIAVVDLLLRAGGEGDLLVTGGYLGGLLVALLVVFVGSVSEWLHQTERTYRIPMDPGVRYDADRTPGQATSD